MLQIICIGKPRHSTLIQWTPYWLELFWNNYVFCARDRLLSRQVPCSRATGRDYYANGIQKARHESTPTPAAISSRVPLCFNTSIALSPLSCSARMHCVLFPLACSRRPTNYGSSCKATSPQPLRVRSSFWAMEVRTAMTCHFSSRLLTNHFHGNIRLHDNVKIVDLVTSAGPSHRDLCSNACWIHPGVRGQCMRTDCPRLQPVSHLDALYFRLLRALSRWNPI